MDAQIIKNRIVQVLKEHDYSINRLAKGDAALSRKLLRQLNGETELTISVLDILLNEFPDVSAEWLLRGRDEQPENQHGESHATANGDGAIAIAGSGNITIPKQVWDMLAEKDRQIAARDEIIREYIIKK